MSDTETVDSTELDEVYAMCHQAEVERDEYKLQLEYMGGVLELEIKLNAEAQATISNLRESLVWALRHIGEPRLVRGQNDAHFAAYSKAAALATPHDTDADQGGGR